MTRLAIVVAIATVTSVARADAPPWHAGLDLRVDQGAHPIRVGGGVTFGSIDTLLVLDPMVVTDGQHDLDVLASVGERYSVVAGWRTTTIGLVDGHQFQEKLIVGVGAPLPMIGGAVRARWALELATVVVKHGGGLPTETISFASGRDFIDLINFGMFVTFEYASAH
jgi:hypothetical protein